GGLAHDRALQAEPTGAELVALGHGLVRGSEVEGGVGQALVDEDAERHEHDGEDAERQPAPPAPPGRPGGRARGGVAALVGVVGEGAACQLHRRSAGGTWRDSLRPRRTSYRAEAATT